MRSGRVPEIVGTILGSTMMRTTVFGVYLGVPLFVEITIYIVRGYETTIDW